MMKKSLSLPASYSLESKTDDQDNFLLNFKLNYKKDEDDNDEDDVLDEDEDDYKKDLYQNPIGKNCSRLQSTPITSKTTFKNEKIIDSLLGQIYDNYNNNCCSMSSFNSTASSYFISDSDINSSNNVNSIRYERKKLISNLKNKSNHLIIPLCISNRR